MRLATTMCSCLLALLGACSTDEPMDRAVPPALAPSAAPTRTNPDPPATITSPPTPATKPDVAPSVAGLVNYNVSGRHVGESFVVAVDGTYTLDIDDDGIPPATGTLTATELTRLRAAIAATAGVAPPEAPTTLPSEPPPVVGVTTMTASASGFRNDDMPGPWGKLAAELAALRTTHSPEPPFVATLAPDAKHMTLHQRSAAPVPACFAAATVTVLGRGDMLVRTWQSPPLEPGAELDELAHGPRVARCTPSPRPPGWTLVVPLADETLRRGETLYASVHAIVSGESTTVSAEASGRAASSR